MSTRSHSKYCLVCRHPINEPSKIDDLDKLKKTVSTFGQLIDYPIYINDSEFDRIILQSINFCVSCSNTLQRGYNELEELKSVESRLKKSKDEIQNRIFGIPEPEPEKEKEDLNPFTIIEYRNSIIKRIKKTMDSITKPIMPHTTTIRKEKSDEYEESTTSTSNGDDGVSNVFLLDQLKLNQNNNFGASTSNEWTEENIDLFSKATSAGTDNLEIIIECEETQKDLQRKKPEVEKMPVLLRMDSQNNVEDNDDNMPVLYPVASLCESNKDQQAISEEEPGCTLTIDDFTDKNTSNKLNGEVFFKTKNHSSKLFESESNTASDNSAETNFMDKETSGRKENPNKSNGPTSLLSAENNCKSESNNSTTTKPIIASKALKDTEKIIPKHMGNPNIESEIEFPSITGKSLETLKVHSEIERMDIKMKLRSSSTTRARNQNQKTNHHRQIQKTNLNQKTKQQNQKINPSQNQRGSKTKIAIINKKKKLAEIMANGKRKEKKRIRNRNRPSTTLITTCSTCNITFGERRDLLAHNSLLHTKIVSCNVCLKDFKAELTLKIHLRTHGIGETLFKCGLCGKFLSTKSGLKEHNECAHGEPRSLRCELCPKGFTRKKDLRFHVASKHLGIRVVCSQEGCDKKFTTTTAMKAHVRKEHMKDFKYFCPKRSCNNKGFLNLSSRVLHYDKVHLKIKPFKCSECDKDFSSNWRMKQHKIQKHSGPHSFPCSSCPKLFATDTKLARHALEVHLEGETDFSCTKCPKKFVSSSRLKDHNLNKHVARSGRLIKCSICYKGFTAKSHLRVHERNVHKK